LFGAKALRDTTRSGMDLKPAMPVAVGNRGAGRLDGGAYRLLSQNPYTLADRWPPPPVGGRRNRAKAPRALGTRRGPHTPPTRTMQFDLVRISKTWKDHEALTKGRSSAAVTCVPETARNCVLKPASSPWEARKKSTEAGAGVLARKTAEHRGGIFSSWQQRHRHGPTRRTTEWGLHCAPELWRAPELPSV